MQRLSLTSVIRNARSLGRRPAWAAVYLIAVVGTAVPAFAGGNTVVPQPGPTEPPAAFDGPNAAAYSLKAQAQVQRAVEAQRAAEEARKEKLASPDLVSEREASETAYDGLSDERAFALTQERFGKAIAGANPDVQDFVGAGMIGGFLDDFSVRVDNPGTEQDRIVIGPTPLRAEDESGKNAAVDLDLEQSGDSFEPQNSVADVTLPATLEDGAVVGQMRVFPGAPAAGDQDGRHLGDSGVFYPGTGRATDSVLVPTTTGVESFTILRAKDAPEEQELRLDLPAGAKLTGTAAGGVDILKDEKPIGRILPPSAVDSQGQSVPVSYRVRGATVTVVVSHHEGSWAYPILSDPIVQDWSGSASWYSGGTAGLNEWAYATNTSSDPAVTPFLPRTTCAPGVPACPTTNSGLFMYAYPNRTVPAGSYGQWVYSPPGQTTRIPSVQLYPTYTHGRGNPTDSPKNTNLNPYPYVGIWSTASNDWRAITAMLADQNGSTQSLAPAAPNNGKNQVALGFVSTAAVAPGQNPAYKDAYVGGAYIQLDDPETPRFTSTANTVPSTANPATAWLGTPRKDEQFTVSPAAIDAAVGTSATGLGIFAIAVGGYVDITGTPTGTGQVWSAGCTGVGASPCPSSKALTGPDALKLSMDDLDPTLPGHQKLSEGKRVLTVAATDPVGKSSNFSIPIWVDRTGPAITLQGGDWDGSNSLATMDGQELTSPAYTLTASATDGPVTNATAETSRSGVRRIEIQVDGNPDVAPFDTACTTSNCSRNRPTFTFTTASYTPGWHEVTTIATDQAGNRSTKTINVKVGDTGEMISPESGATTAQRFTLAAKKNSGSATQAKFQYRRDQLNTWQDIPVSDLRDEQGASLASGLVPISGAGETQRVVWDAAHTFAQLPIGQQDGPVQIRALFSTTSGPAGGTKALLASVDQRGLASNDAAADIGPGSVDLLTGNFSFSAEDVSVESFSQALTFARTFNSRDPNSTADGPFGPGWTTSTPVDQGGSVYSAVREIPDGTEDVELVLWDGSTIYFDWTGTTYVPEAGAEDLALTRVGVDLVLTDADKYATTFHKPPGSARVFKPTSTKQPSSGTAVTFSYENFGDEGRVKRAFAPAPNGINCDVTTPPPGCRVLEFEYSTQTTATGTSEGQWGQYQHRLKAVHFWAADDANVPQRDDVAMYSYDNEGRLRAAWDPRSPVNVGGAPLKEKYDYDSGGRLTSVDPADGPTWAISYQALAADNDGGRLRSVGRAGESGLAVETVVYKVPLSGAGAPNAMGATDVSAWAQHDVPTDATAIFPPDQIPSGSPPASYTRATIHYLDHEGREVTTATPGGRIAVHEYDAHGNVDRELTPANRERAAAALGTAAKESLWTQRVYTADGVDKTDEYEPVHETKLESGSVVQASQHTHIGYEDHLPTRVETGAHLATGPDQDVRVTTTAYDAVVRKPTLRTVDPGGKNLVSTWQYNQTTGQELTRSRGSSQDQVDTTYCTQARWYGLPCEERPHVDVVGGAGPLPTTTFTYNRLYQVTTQAQSRTLGGVTTSKTTTLSYDVAGRQRTESTVGAGSGAGISVPSVTTTYDSGTGRTTGAASSDGKTITVVMDSLGRQTGYTDADGVTTTTTYDLLDRPVSVNDQKGTRTSTYDPVTEDLVSVSDSQAGTFGATYNADGDAVSKTYPGGLAAAISYDEIGTAREVEYSKNGSTWYEDHITESIHGQWAEEHATDLDRDYAYDGAGRLAGVKDTQNGQCTTRSYTYDGHSNRTARTERSPGLGGGCVETGSGQTQSNSFDIKDRQDNQGFNYDAFGRQTQIPASHAGGGTLTTAFYVTGAVRSQSQDGTTKEWSLDPARRQNGTIAGGGNTGREVLHYSDDSDSSGWSETLDGANTVIEWSRNIEGIDGDLAAIRSHDSQGDKTELQLTNLHGDVVALANTDPAASSPTARFRADEFGNPQGVSHAKRYGWLGAENRRTELASGVIQMGVRSYVPNLGRFSSVDPVVGGSLNDYDYAGADPVNAEDLDGRWISFKKARKWAQKKLNKLGNGVKKKLTGAAAKTLDVARKLVAKVIKKLGFGRVSRCVTGAVAGFHLAPKGAHWAVTLLFVGRGCLEGLSNKFRSPYH